MRNLYEELKKRLHQGFFPDNLLQVARLAEEASWQTERPLGLYVLSRILITLAGDWPKQGMETSVAEEMRRVMEPVIAGYLSDAAAKDLTAEEEAAHLNNIVRSFLSWRSTHD